ncbi:MAG: choice-of-anchor J domain-containing protein [Bacteroidetes bacterium]|nr:choice-of-anchor J domain-containing protein [Bacteroidota bacterium]
MKKITLLLFTICITFSVKAQNTCLAPTIVVEGATTTVGSIDGNSDNTCGWSTPAANGEWYTYTATINGVINITSNFVQNDGGLKSDDTRLSVFTGTCAALTCYTLGDDIDDSNFLTDITFQSDSGVTYYFLWDNRWSSLGFDFSLTETAVSCPDGSLPMSEDFSDGGQFVVCWENIDDDGDGQSWYHFDYDGGNPTANSASWNISPLTPDNWLISYAIDLTAYATTDIIDLTWVARGLDPDFPEENYSVYAANNNLIATLKASPVFFTETLVDGGEGDGVFTPTRTLDLSPLAGGMVYIAFRHHAFSDQFIINIDNVAISGTLGIGDLTANSFKQFYNKELDILTLKSNTSAFSNIKLFNMLGQQIMNRSLTKTNETINMASLKDGIYIAKISIDDSEKTVKLLKN